MEACRALSLIAICSAKKERVEDFQEADPQEVSGYREPVGASVSSDIP